MQGLVDCHGTPSAVAAICALQYITAMQDCPFTNTVKLCKLWLIVMACIRQWSPCHLCTAVHHRHAALSFYQCSQIMQALVDCHGMYSAVATLPLVPCSISLLSSTCQPNDSSKHITPLEISTSGNAPSFGAAILRMCGTE